MSIINDVTSSCSSGMPDCLTVDGNDQIMKCWPHLKQHSNTLWLYQTKFHPKSLAKSCRGSSCHRGELMSILVRAVQNIFSVNQSSLKCSSYQAKTWKWMDFEIHINKKLHEILKNINILMKKLSLSHFTFFLQLFYFLAKLGSQEWKKTQWFSYHSIFTSFMQSLDHDCFLFQKDSEPCISVHSCSKWIFTFIFTFFGPPPPRTNPANPR